jgi:hypothetical protein
MSSLDRSELARIHGGAQFDPVWCPASAAAWGTFTGILAKVAFRRGNRATAGVATTFAAGDVALNPNCGVLDRLRGK